MVVATSVVDGAAAGLAVVAVRDGFVVVVVAGRVVVVAVVDVVVGATDVVVSSSAVVGSVTSAPVRWMAGSLLPWGTPAMATPTPAHTTSISAVIVRCPGLTADAHSRHETYA
jgi:hypothetical protein